MIDPILPTPEQIPKPLVLTLVSNVSVVTGYISWIAHFIKKRAIEVNIMLWVYANKQWHKPAQAKYRTIDFFLPKLGWSIM